MGHCGYEWWIHSWIGIGGDTFSLGVMVCGGVFVLGMYWVGCASSFDRVVGCFVCCNEVVMGVVLCYV